MILCNDQLLPLADVLSLLVARYGSPIFSSERP